MKTKDRISILIILLCVLTSCVTTSQNSEVTPLNLYSKRLFASDNRVFFVGEGQADNVRQAELLSYVDLCNKVYRYLGTEVEPEVYRELSTAGTISAYDVKIQEKTSYASDGIFTYALIASADKNLLAEDRSPDMQKEEEIALQAVELVLLGDEYIKANEDIQGLKCYLQSMQYSYGLQYIDEEFSFLSILEEVLNVIDALQIDISKVDSENASCTVKVTRQDTIIPSRVKNSIIKSTYVSEDSRGQVFTDQFMYTTDSKGLIKFIPRAYNMLKVGTITFGFDFENEIQIIEKLSPSTALTLRQAVEKKNTGFSYAKQYSGGQIAICLQCVNAQGQTEKDSWLDDYLVAKYSESNIEAFVFEYVEDENEEELIERFKKLNPDVGNLIVFRVGVNDIIETRMDIASVSVEGTVVAYNTESGEIIYDSGVTYANGFGATVSEAQDTAYRNFVLKMFTLLKAYYV